METLTLKDAFNFAGYLEKKSPSMFKGWQKRWFKILEGRLLTYSDSEKDTELKGSIDLTQISDLKANEKKCIQFKFGDREWDLKAESGEVRDKWIKVLNLLISEIKKINNEDVPDVRQRSATSRGIWKPEQQGKETHEILKKSGYKGKDDELAEKALKLKLKNLNSELPEVKCRIQYGFLNKKHKKDYLFQKRWCFIISSRPVNDVDYEKDDLMIYKNPHGISLDTLYYYTFEDENDDGKFKGQIQMSECSEVASFEKDEKFFLTIDLGDRKYEFQSEVKGVRDKWYSALRCVKKTSKEIKISITKKPRNISKLLKIISNEGNGNLKEFCEKEKDAILGNYKDIKDFELLEGHYIEQLQNMLYQTLDTCVLSDPPKLDIIKVYVETYNTAYLLLIQKYWGNCYADLNQSQIVKLASFLFNHEENLTKFGITDPNFSQNGRELIKIFIKKTFVNMKTIIESILKSEREVKAVQSRDGILITNGPLDVFKMLYSLVDIFRRENYKIKYIIEQLLNLAKECFIQYLIGVDCVISKEELDIDKEFLIAISNNCIKLNSQLEEFTDEIKTLKVLTEKEVDDASGEKEINTSLVLISNNSITRFVNDLSDAIVNSFQDHFLTLDLNKIIEVTFTTYGNFVKFMHNSIQKKCWNEVLKATLYQYIKSLLTTGHKKVKVLEELTKKLRSDQEMLFLAYKNAVGEFATKETLKILDDFLDFLDVSPDMISVSCTKLREFNGPSFTVSTAKALIGLRCDLSKQEKNDAIKSCKEILENFISSGPNNNKASGFFVNLENDIKIQERIDQQENEESSNLEEIEEFSPKNTRRATINLTDFLNLGVDLGDLSESDKAKEDESKPIIMKGQPGNEMTIDSDVAFSGVMKKKSYNTWQERFFQIKNGFLYWYINKNSKESQNSIALSEMKKVQGHKSCKFTIICGEKIYKFSCENDDLKESWIKALNSEIKKLKGEISKKLENIFEVKLKKKVIQDFYNLPNINSEKLYMKKRVDADLKTENNFPEKIKAKPKIKHNQKIVEKKNNKEEEFLREKNNPSNASTKSNISPMEVALIDDKPKNTSIFSCCNKLMMMFKKKKPLSEEA